MMKLLTTSGNIGVQFTWLNEYYNMSAWLEYGKVYFE